MFKVTLIRTPKPGKPMILAKTDLIIIDEDLGVKLTNVHAGPDFEYGFKYEDGTIEFVFSARVVFDEKKHWLISLGNDIEDNFGETLSINDALNVAKNIRDGLAVYAYASEGAISDVRFDMSKWHNWDHARGKVLLGDEI